MKRKFLLLTVVMTAVLLLMLVFSSCTDKDGTETEANGGSETSTSTDTADTSTDTEDTSTDSSGGSSIMGHEHFWSIWVRVKEPTCAEEGLDERRCTLCGETESEMVEKTRHEYSEKEIPPIGGELGYIEYVCTGCGDTYCEEKEIEYSKGLFYSINDDGVSCTVTSYGTCYDSTLLIPPEIDGYKVTKIGNGAFKYCSAREIVIPDTVTEIDTQAFYWCTKLVYLTLGAGVQTVGAQAFEGCTLLADIRNSSSLTLTKGSDEYGRVAKKAINIHTDAKNGKYGERGDCAFYEYEGTVYMLAYLGGSSVVTLPNDYNARGYEICSNAFMTTQLYSITIPKLVMKINDGAFEYQTNLIEVINLSDLDIVAGGDAHGGVAKYAMEVHQGASKVVTEGGDYIFYNLDGHDYLIKYLGYDDEITLPTFTGKSYSIYDGAFYVSFINKVVIPEGVVKIGSNAFASSFLTEVVLPSTLKEIGDYAFYGCEITEITIPSGVTKIGDSAFSRTSLSNAVVPASVESLGSGAFSLCENLVSVELNEGLVEIGLGAFENSTKLERIKIPNSVESLGIRAFGNCTSLQSAIVGDGVKEFDYAFWGCTALGEVVLPEGLERIGFGSFCNCKSLASIDIPNGVSSIGQGAFENCELLESIALPDNITIVWGYTFRGCKSLKYVDFGGATSFSYEAFSGTAIETLKLPEKTTSVDRAAFNCSTLKEVYLPINVYSVSGEAFGTNSIVVYYLGTLEDFEEYRPWLAEKQEFYIYSAEEPTDTEHMYWHYGSNGEATKW